MHLEPNLPVFHAELLGVRAFVSRIEFSLGPGGIVVGGWTYMLLARADKSPHDLHEKLPPVLLECQHIDIVSKIVS